LTNGRNRRVLPIARRSGEGRLTQPKAGAQPWPRERVLMPLSRPSRYRLRVRLESARQRIFRVGFACSRPAAGGAPFACAGYPAELQAVRDDSVVDSMGNRPAGEASRPKESFWRSRRKAKSGCGRFGQVDVLQSAFCRPPHERRLNRGCVLPHRGMFPGRQALPHQTTVGI
jgi:hypothetical protein